MNIHRNQKKTPIPAATIVLARQHANDLQVYLLKRGLASRFMAGTYVFPGGIVDVEDRKFQFWKDRVDLDQEAMVQRLGGHLSAEETLAFSVAAIRETLEESGVFLATRRSPQPKDLDRVQGLRLSSNLPRDWFSRLTESEGWILTLATLHRWSHWVTPEPMPHRFDTRFFVAPMPTDQACQPDFRETTDGLWVSPREGLAGNISGDIPLSPPTLITLHELLQYRNLEALITAASKRPWGEALLPRLIPLDHGAVIVEPWDAMFNQNEMPLNNADLASSVLPVGATFSRIWYNGSIWQPVRS